MAPPLLLLQDIRLTIGATPLLDGAELSVSPGERLGLVGRNGSGKSTLLKIAAGEIEADGGTRFLQPGATVRYMPQEPDLSGFATTLAYVEAGLAPGDDPYRARYLLEALGLHGKEDPQTLSGGEARRAALARVLAPEPDILLLDEPTNHLDLPAIEWLEGELRALRSALVLISHDRRFLENLSRATLWLDRGTTRRLEQGFAAFEGWRDALLAEEERDRQKLDRKIAAEEDWVRYGVTARRKRNQRRLALLDAMRRERREERRAAGAVKLTVTEGETSGTLVVETRGVSKSFGGAPVVRDFSIRIRRGDRIGLVGPNGAGKTTLLNLLTGALGPDAGTVRLGANLQMVTLDQRRAALDPAVSLREALTGGRGDTVFVGGAAKHVVSYMKDFLFAPEQQNSPVGTLSGGERGRLMLARALAQPSNLLVLDEPTNDLDLETLDLLQEMIADYPGTVLLVSHDRDFLDRTVTSTIMAEGDGRWVEYAGGYSDMLAQRGRGVEARTAAAKQPRPKERERATGSPPPGTAEPKRRRLSFTEKHALETLPARIEKLTADVAKLNAILADHELYARDPDRFAKATALLAKTQAELEAAEEQWLTLEMLREELETQA
ncbi:ABC-F family ATP-binding cassette domain-containing protein [Chelatococcus sp. SYSU_G07232]|uniref:ATP-binding protein Uup n=1 Tax=Chelatococcus albus TaxID=3047466 RepID=A0ABT7AIZ0_9HYPH|nr:ABC-F family ATP-binding cassette domain-containing protein [Chelatococcus sp. SYSU_G07232]MDJ1159346.1 ABC-F family ATP-binding cassette domain-containing protein [Chelatococcus sp. SYSU_G07232]